MKCKCCPQHVESFMTFDNNTSDEQFEHTHLLSQFCDKVGDHEKNIMEDAEKQPDPKHLKKSQSDPKHQ